jgi:chromatin structure-remodeling complex subunit RSC1/2
MPGDAIEVRESIEAKGDVDDDIEMEDADSPERKQDEDVDMDADGDADGHADADTDADGEPDDMDEQARQEEEWRNTLQLIKDTSEYLCRYTIKVDGEYVFWPPLHVVFAMRHDADWLLSGTTRSLLGSSAL